MNIELTEGQIYILQNGLVREIQSLCNQRAVYDLGTDERSRLEAKIATAKSLLVELGKGL